MQFFLAKKDLPEPTSGYAVIGSHNWIQMPLKSNFRTAHEWKNLMAERVGLAQQLSQINLNKLFTQLERHFLQSTRV